MAADDRQGSEPLSAPGWDFIDRWVSQHFPNQTPHQFSSNRPYELDSRSPLPAITVWSTKAPAGWLYVTYGLSELFEKSSADPNTSGFGFELSFRLPPAPSDPDPSRHDATPPRWPLMLLQGLGHHLLSNGGQLDTGDCVGLGAPLVPPGSDGPEGCVLNGLVALPDPQLGKVTGPNGSLLFLRVFGLTTDEMDALGELELGPLVGCIAELSPAALTDPTRRSYLEHPELGKIVRRYRLGVGLN